MFVCVTVRVSLCSPTENLIGQGCCCFCCCIVWIEAKRTLAFQMFYFSTHSKAVGWLMPLSLKYSWPPMLSICLYMNWYWNEPLLTVGQVFNTEKSSEWFIVAGCFFCFLFCFCLFPFLVHVVVSYVTWDKKKKSARSVCSLSSI